MNLKYKIVLAPFPFGDILATKTRPVLCITDIMGKFDEILVAYITSKTPQNMLVTDLELKANPQTGLKKDSVVRLHKLFTLPKAQILGLLGEITESKQQKVYQKLVEMIS